VLDDPSNRPEYGQDGIHVLAAPSPVTGHDLAMAHAQQIVAFVATRIPNPTFADNVRAAAPFRVTVPPRTVLVVPSGADRSPRSKSWS
jgi:hypothetical protein